MVDELPAGLSAAGFGFRDGIREGLTAGRLRGPALVAPFRGVRATAEPATPLDRALAFAPLLRPWQCLGGIQAMAMLGLPIPWVPARSTLVDVVSDSARSRPVRTGVRTRRVPAELLDVGEVGGLRVASASLTWALMASRCTVHDLVVIGDAIVSNADNYPDRRLPGPLATLHDLRAMASRWEGRTGAAALRDALPQIRERVESPRETDMRLFIVGAGMPEPEVQVTIRDPESGRKLGRADLLHRGARVVEEYEGHGHRAKGQWDRDIQKYRDFERIGFRVVRATNRDFVPSPKRWLTELAAVLRQRMPS